MNVYGNNMDIQRGNIVKEMSYTNYKIWLWMALGVESKFTLVEHYKLNVLIMAVAMSI